jgi:predicted GIY-YIG superfamily endonuclease
MSVSGEERATRESVREEVEDAVRGVWGRHAVYILECADRRAEDVRVDAAALFGETPSWVGPACRADRCFYVGMSGNVVERVYHHVNRKETGARFTKLFPPIDVHGVKFFRTRPEAFDEEKRAAQQLRLATSDEIYVYQY